GEERTGGRRSAVRRGCAAGRGSGVRRAVMRAPVSSRRLRRSAALALVVVGVALPLHDAHAQEAAASTTPPSATKPADEKKGEDGFLGQLSLSSSDEPIVVRSDQLEFDYEANRVIYRGTVN